MGQLVSFTLFTRIVRLWGAALVQVYIYYDVSGSQIAILLRIGYLISFQRYWKTDRAWLKVYVGVGWALDTIHQGLITKALYTYLITNFGNFLFLTFPQR